jgi:glycolate oxidase FAD binding subunit
MEPVCHIDGFGPLPLVRPGSVEELGEVVRRAGLDGAALYPVGGGTQLGLGRPPIKAGFGVDLRGLDRVIDFPARDMTVTVQAGIGVARLQAMLAPENLRLPIDVPQADRATLGGIIATNISGPRRFGFGTLRDYVIGISAVNDEGREFKAGGRVVKNVAGYDLCKLLVGALGTLGIVTQVTLKLRPLAEEQALMCLETDPAGVEPLLTWLHGSRTRPVAVELLNRPAAADVFGRAGLAVPAADWAVIVGYEGNVEVVRWQVQQLVKEVGTACRLEARVGFTAGPLWDALVAGAGGPEPAVAFKANLLPSAVAAFCRAADRAAERPLLQAHAGSGIVWGRWPDGLNEARATELRSAWRAEAAKGQGGVVVHHCPPAWKKSLAVWDAPADAWLMRAVKEQFDPRRVFNPGRFVEGI